MAYEKIGEIRVAKVLRDFIGDEVLPGTDIGAGQFWSGLAGLIDQFAPRIRGQLRFRDELQGKIDEYHRTTGTMPFNPAGYAKFLREIGENLSISVAYRKPELKKPGSPAMVWSMKAASMK